MRHAQRVDAYEQVLLRPPASPQDIAQAEHVMAITHPHSYRRFLLLTNGLGYPGDTEACYVCGAGPLRANWTAVLLNLWMERVGHHEAAAEWREF
jgi:hypothetical protein